jgi:YidC/Oxa1 family membrane protein insertase
VEKRFILFVVSAVAVFVGWSFFMRRYLPPPAPQALQTPSAFSGAATSSGSGPSSQVPSVSVGAPAASKAFAEKLTQASTDKLALAFSSRGGAISSWKLLAYREHQKDPNPVELVPAGSGSLQYGVLDVPGLNLAEREWTLESGQISQGVISYSILATPGLLLKKTFVLHPGQYLVDLKVEAQAVGKQAMSIPSLSLLWGPGLGQPNPDDRANIQSAAVYTSENTLDRPRPGAGDSKGYPARPKWLAIRNHYFGMALLAGSGPWESGAIRALADRSLVESLSAGLVVQPGSVQSLGVTLFGGPLDYGLLKSLGSQLHRLVNFGWFEFFAIPMLYVLKWFDAIFHNYGIAILLLTILVKAVVWFPTHKSMTSMRHMQKMMGQMKPRLDTLKTIYKDDPSKLNQETMKLYKEYGVNPLGGCLPMLVQMPILFALYSCLNGAFELRGASFAWRWTDLSVKDPTFILPLAMGATMFLQQWMTPAAPSATPEQSQQQRMMMYIMPIMLTGMAIFTGWPAGLLLYWTCSNLLSMLQQYYVNKTIPA